MQIKNSYLFDFQYFNNRRPQHDNNVIPIDCEDWFFTITLHLHEIVTFHEPLLVKAA